MSPAAKVRLSMLFISFLLPCAKAQAGKLSDTERTVSGSDDDDDGGSAWCLFCSDDDDEDEDAAPPVPTTRYETDFSFLPFPYARGRRGYLIVRERVYDPVIDEATGTYSEDLVSDTTTPGDLSVGDGKGVSLTANMGYGYDLDGIHLADVRAAADGSSGFGMGFRWTGFYEPVDDGEIDSLHLYDLFLRGAVVNRHEGRARIGVGGLLMTSGSTPHAGIYGLANLFYLPQRPFALSADLKIGYLDQAAYLHGEAGAGIILGPVELVVSYEARAFASTEDAVLFHGPPGRNQALVLTAVIGAPSSPSCGAYLASIAALI